MSESRYTTRVGDPDETTRIPKEALDGLRDADQAREGASASSSSSLASPPKPGNGSPGTGRPPAGGLPSAGSAAVPPGGSRPPLFGTGGTGGSTAANGSAFRGEPPSRPSLGGSGSSGSPAGSPPAAASPIGYPERSQTGYSPAAYQGSYSSAMSGPGGPGPSVAAAGLGGATAARGALGTSGRPSPAVRGAAGSRPPRRARLLVRHIDPWSTLKFSFVLSVAMFFVWLVAVGVLYGVLDGMGVFDEINGLYGEVAGNSGDRLFSPGLVLGSATVVGAVNIVLFTALATIGAFVYNICSDLVGGIEITLAERD
jgi:hypothetical protein